MSPRRPVTASPRTIPVRAAAVSWLRQLATGYALGRIHAQAIHHSRPVEPAFQDTADEFASQFVERIKVRTYTPTRQVAGELIVAWDEYVRGIPLVPVVHPVNEEDRDRTRGSRQAFEADLG